MRDQAIRNAHTDVVTIDGGEKAYDVDGKEVTLDETKITAELAKLETSYNDTEYKRKRIIEYPSVEDQLDMLWHAMDDGTLNIDGEILGSTPLHVTMIHNAVSVLV